MFSKNTYMYPHAASPSSHPRTSAAAASLVGLNGSVLHHHHDMLSGHHLTAAALYDQDVMVSLNGDPNSAMAAVPCAVAKASKKDRHSKIETAQGPRDRRVRLSIGVARKFFDLQESLGFDKPSKTLDWLLTKSETAINDLEQMREKTSTEAAKSGGGGGGGGSASPSECEVDSAEAFANGVDLKDKLKESRMKARARARERTREKMCIKKLNETRNNNNNNGGGCDLSPVQLMNHNQLHDFRNINLGFRGEAMLHCHQTYEAAAAAHDQDLIQESIVMKRKVKHHHPSILGFQQNLIISSSNYGVPPLYNASVADNNWDNICAIWDHHKFINGTSNN